MTTTMTQSRCRCHAPLHTRPQGHLRARHSTPLVPKAKVQEMLREIAFVLHATRRISTSKLEANPDVKFPG